MKEKIRLLILVIFYQFQIPIFAHSNHHHKKPVNEDVAKSKGKENIQRLIKEKKVESSWTESKLEKIEKKKFGKKTEWVLTYVNTSIKDESKKKLYIFLKISGEYIAANHTGK